MGTRITDIFWRIVWPIQRLIKRLFIWPWQRVRRGWSDRDAWSGGQYAAGILTDLLTHYADTNRGTRVQFLAEARPGMMLSEATDEDWEAANALQVQQFRQHAEVLRRFAEDAEIYDDVTLRALDMTEEQFLAECGPAMRESELRETFVWLGTNIQRMWD